MKNTIIQYDTQGRPHGTWESLYRDGTLWWRGRYLHGKSHGLCEYYWSDGTLFRKEYYLNVR